jgi:murein DD-endopeptidase MepM/ murein hydrolase activator NlpD
MIQQISRLFAGGICAVLFGAVFVANTYGQTTNNKKLPSEDVKKIRDDLNLVAGKIEIKSQALLIDSALLSMELSEEEEMSPADALYDGEWNNEYVRAYSSISIPDSFKIDVTSFVMPFAGRVTSNFGMRRRRYHFGTDIKLQIGDTVVAAFDGKVRVKKNQGKRKGYGKYLVLRHPNGLETVYGHLSDYLVDLDENVKAGQPIGLGGNTGRSFGSHLHFECRFLGMPLNPERIVDFENQCTFDDYYLFVKSESEKYNYVSAKRATRTQQAKTAAARRKAVVAKTRSTTATSTTAGNIKYHRVREGDTLGAISIKYGVTVSKLCRLNGISATTKLKIGRVLRCS